MRVLRGRVRSEYEEALPQRPPRIAEGKSSVTCHRVLCVLRGESLRPDPRRADWPRSTLSIEKGKMACRCKAAGPRLFEFEKNRSAPRPSGAGGVCMRCSGTPWSDSPVGVSVPTTIWRLASENEDRLRAARPEAPGLPVWNSSAVVRPMRSARHPRTPRDADLGFRKARASVLPPALRLLLRAGEQRLKFARAWWLARAVCIDRCLGRRERILLRGRNRPIVLRSADAWLGIGLPLCSRFGLYGV